MIDKIAFLCPTRGRPQNVAELALAWDTMGTGDYADLIFIVDGDHPEEHDYVRAARGHQVYFQPWRGLSATLNTQALRTAERYRMVGFLGDDHRPRNLDFDAALAVDFDAIGSYSIVYGKDGQPGFDGMTGFGPVQKDSRHHPMTWWAMTSNIVRLLGQMVPWPLSHTCVDDYVWQLGFQSDILWMDWDVTFEHLHPLWGKSSSDASYELSSNHHNRLADHVKWEEYQRVQLPRDVRLINMAKEK